MNQVDPMIGRYLGPYQLTHLLGQGGMGVVYEAFHRHLQVSYAIKILHPSLTEDWVFVERLRREAIVALQLQHRNIVQVLDYSWDESFGFYIIMELLRGEGLNSTLHRLFRMDLPPLAEIIYQICDALALAHSHQIVHRDLKPGNVFLIPQVDGRQEVKLLDFGLARLLESNGQDLTRAGQTTGTPQYMPPEQILSRKQEIGPASDIYALAGVIFRALTGGLPFKGTSLVHFLKQVVVQAPPPISLVHPSLRDTYLEKILLQCLAKKPEKRISSAREFKEAFRYAVEDDPKIIEFLEEDQQDFTIVQGDYQTQAKDDPQNLLDQFNRKEENFISGGEAFVFDGETFVFDGQELHQGGLPSSPSPQVVPPQEETLALDNLSSLENVLQIQDDDRTLNLDVSGLAAESEAVAPTLVGAQYLPNPNKTNPSHQGERRNSPIPKPLGEPPPQPRQVIPEEIPPPQKEKKRSSSKPVHPPKRNAFFQVAVRLFGGFLLGFLVIGSVLWILAGKKKIKSSPEGGQWRVVPSTAKGRAIKASYYYLRILSTPSKARVIEQGKLLGLTPLSIRRPAGSSLYFVIEKNGYELSAGSWVAKHDRKIVFTLRQRP